MTATVTWRGGLQLVGVGVLGVLAGASLAGGGDAGAAPPAPPDHGFGRAETCLLDAASGCTVLHRLGVKPTAVTVTHGGFNGVPSVDPASITATSYRYVVYRNDGTRFAAGVRANWNAHYDLPAGGAPVPTTPPPPPPTTTPPPPLPPTTTPPPPPSPTTDPPPVTDPPPPEPSDPPPPPPGP